MCVARYAEAIMIDARGLVGRCFECCKNAVKKNASHSSGMTNVVGMTGSSNDKIVFIRRVKTY